jgi:hypothetical protein
MTQINRLNDPTVKMTQINRLYDHTACLNDPPVKLTQIAGLSDSVISRLALRTCNTVSEATVISAIHNSTADQ